MLLFDGKTLNGWTSANTAPPGRGRGPGSAAKQGKAPAQPGAAPQVGSNPRACSTPVGLGAVPEGASHWEVVHSLLVPCGEPAGYLTSKGRIEQGFCPAGGFQNRQKIPTAASLFTRLKATAAMKCRSGRRSRRATTPAPSSAQPRLAGSSSSFRTQWNHYEITSKGDHIVIVLNGTKTLDVQDSKFPDGRIRLQYQKFPIEFKNIKLKLIKN